MLILRYCKKVLLGSVQWRDTFVSVTFTAMLIWFVTTLLVYKNKNNSITENPCGG